MNRSTRRRMLAATATGLLATSLGVRNVLADRVTPVRWTGC
ncbi:hypothetical protein OHQ88_23000 [Micromonospora zamorensis]|uniref:Uncharacterized protein n=1 Tax=Micromonospora zamorensis TaxID=709883 RepID=A0ABZ1PA84_9ACTN|nr:hypothetical protein [Micromonospora zamorensis]WSK46442.1 hypothetical protein OG423_20635 [Micromonospora zamorensis]WTE84889.1 hypothetical protein OHA01_20005 [Micromonospora zamorensis]SCG71933.1 hypothetical protein GA0070619_6448 [Micromonospora zamorensis]